MCAEFADGFFKDAGECAAPAGMNGGDNALFGIDEKNRDAVGGLDAQEKPGSFGERGIAFAGFFRVRGEWPNDGGMDLLENNEREFLGAERGLEFFAVGKDVFARIPFREAEIKDLATTEIGDAARGRAEAVDEPGKLVERLELKNFKAVAGFQDPGFKDFW